MQLVRAKSYEFKPPMGARLDLSNALTANLRACIIANEGAGRVQEFFTGKTLTSGTPAWGTTNKYGLGQNVAATAAKVFSGASDSRLNFVVSPITVCSFGYVATAAGFKVCGGVFDGVNTGNGRWGIGTNATSWQLFAVANGGDVPSTIATAVGAYFVCASWDGANVNFFVNGATQTVANSTTPSPNAGGFLYFGGDNNAPTNSAFNGTVSGLLAWSRVLSLPEMQKLYVNPWQIFATAARMRPSSISIEPLLNAHLCAPEAHMLVRQ